MYSKLDDNELIDLMKADDSRAFTEIYNRYWKLLFSVAGNKSDTLADAEEIVQEVFFDLWKRRKTITIHLSLKSFLAAAVKFQVYSGLAKKHRESIRKNVYGAFVQSMISAEELFHVKMLKQQLEDAALQLPERCRLIYQLSREEGLSNKQIADSLHIAEKTVESQMTKALKHLRKVTRSFFLLHL